MVLPFVGGMAGISLGKLALGAGLQSILFGLGYTTGAYLGNRAWNEYLDPLPRRGYYSAPRTYGTRKLTYATDAVSKVDYYGSHSYLGTPIQKVPYSDVFKPYKVKMYA